ncbi:MAG: GxxExxY protein [Alphaproteobacteria bacterium]|jgi:GxxExxY protein|nr:GxxExxY protein [Alphaproteobacteria bacterium]
MNLKVISTIDPEVETLAKQVVDAAFQVHSIMGPGLLEKVYEECFMHELKDRNIPFETQRSVSLKYKNHDLKTDFKMDLVVNGKIIVELKSVEKLMDVHTAQVMSYMRMMNIRLGFLVNFNVPLIKDGIKRIVI